MKTVARWLLAGALCLFAGTGLLAQKTPAGRYPLYAETIARALHADGFEVEAEAVHLPMALTAAVEHPGLELTGAERLPDGRMRVRLHCRKPSECLPFSVTLERAHRREADPASQGTSLVSLRQSAAIVSSREGGTNPLGVAADTVGEPQAVPADLHRSEPAATATAPLVSIPVGAKLTMLMEEGHLHIHIPVTALDSSSTGRDVRVASLDHKHVYRAIVVDAATVQGIVE